MSTRSLVFNGAIFTLALSATEALASPCETEVRLEGLKIEGKVVEAKSNRVYYPFVGRDYPDQVLLGDMHFHTNLSFDAGLIGTSLDAHDGYKVARGEKVI